MNEQYDSKALDAGRGSSTQPIQRSDGSPRLGRISVGYEENGLSGTEVGKESMAW